MGNKEIHTLKQKLFFLVLYMMIEALFCLTKMSSVLVASAMIFRCFEVQNCHSAGVFLVRKYSKHSRRTKIPSLGLDTVADEFFSHVLGIFLLLWTPLLFLSGM